MKIYFIVLLSIMQLCLVQCNSSKKDYVTKSQNRNAYFPLKDNISWLYINEAPREETITINVECKQRGSKFFLDKFPFFGEGGSEAELYIDDSSNINVKEKSGVSHLLIPAESKIADGYKWKYSDLLNAYMTAAPVDVKTEAGTFSCIYIVFTDGFTFSYEMWLAKDIGVVKWGANRTNPPSTPVYYVLKEHKE